MKKGGVLKSLLPLTRVAIVCLYCMFVTFSDQVTTCYIFLPLLQISIPEEGLWLRACVSCSVRENKEARFCSVEALIYLVLFFFTIGTKPVDSTHVNTVKAVIWECVETSTANTPTNCLRCLLGLIKSCRFCKTQTLPGVRHCLNASTFLHAGKKISAFLPYPWEATVWHASNAPTHTPSQSAPSLLRCPQVPINTHLSGLSVPCMLLHGRTGPASDWSVWCW